MASNVSPKFGSYLLSKVGPETRFSYTADGVQQVTFQHDDNSSVVIPPGATWYTGYNHQEIISRNDEILLHSRVNSTKKDILQQTGLTEGPISIKPHGHVTESLEVSVNREMLAALSYLKEYVKKAKLVTAFTPFTTWIDAIHTKRNSVFLDTTAEVKARMTVMSHSLPEEAHAEALQSFSHAIDFSHTVP